MSDRCPTCGSDDPKVRKLIESTIPTADIECPDPWHAGGSVRPRPKRGLTEQERIVAWAMAVANGDDVKRPTDLRIARAILGLAKGAR